MYADAKQAQGFISFFRKLPEVWPHPILRLDAFSSFIGLVHSAASCSIIEFDRIFVQEYRLQF